MWRALCGTIVNPLRTFAELERDSHAARYGALVLLGVSLVYTAILAIFISKGYPAAGRSILGLPVERQYVAQIWYQAPLFFASTALIAALLAVASRLASNSLAFGTAFGRLGLATAVPFALSTMLVESTVAALMGFGVLRPLATLQCLQGPGAWFAALYQGIGLVWLVALVVVAVRTSGLRSWWVSAPVGLLLVVVYGLPIALFIR